MLGRGGHYVEITHRGLDHHDVGALVEVQLDLAQRLAQRCPAPADRYADRRTGWSSPPRGTGRRTPRRTSPRRPGSPRRCGRRRPGRREWRPPVRPSSRSAPPREHPIPLAPQPVPHSGPGWRRCRPGPFVEDTAVPVVGELVQAGVGHQHGGVTEVLGQIAKRDVEDAVGIGAGRTGRVLVLLRVARRTASAHRRRRRRRRRRRCAANRGCAAALPASTRSAAVRRYRRRRTSAAPNALAPRRFAPPGDASPGWSGADADGAADTHSFAAASVRRMPAPTACWRTNTHARPSGDH